MSEHYLRGSQFYQASPTIHQSRTWKWNCNLRVQALSHMKKQLGNGRTSSLFLDNWLRDNSDSLIHHLSGYNITTEELNYHVSDIVDNVQ